jgi:hypothetical protein
VEILVQFDGFASKDIGDFTKFGGGGVVICSFPAPFYKHLVNTKLLSYILDELAALEYKQFVSSMPREVESTNKVEIVVQYDGFASER